MCHGGLVVSKHGLHMSGLVQFLLPSGTTTGEDAEHVSLNH